MPQENQHTFKRLKKIAKTVPNETEPREISHLKLHTELQRRLSVTVCVHTRLLCIIAILCN